MFNSKFKIQNSKLLTQAFTTIELIFVIIIIAIIASVGVGFIPNYDLENDTNYIFMQIKEKQKNALSYDTNEFGTLFWTQPDENTTDYNLTCIEFTKDSLEALDTKKTYKIRSAIDASMVANDTLCFDFLGRPYEYGATKVQLLLNNVDINVTKNGKTKTISVFPMSGYAKIK